MQTNEPSQKTQGLIVHGERMQFIVENIKCDGCAKTIRKTLEEIGFKNISVNFEQCSIEVDTPSDVSAVSIAVKKLKDLGYPLIETEEGLTAALLKVKSYLSCAIGKIS